MMINEALTEDVIVEAAERTMFGDGMVGLCISCGEEQIPVEPDAEDVHCEACGDPRVFGAEQLLLMVVA